MKTIRDNKLSLPVVFEMTYNCRIISSFCHEIVPIYHRFVMRLYLSIVLVFVELRLVLTIVCIYRAYIDCDSIIGRQLVASDQHFGSID